MELLHTLRETGTVLCVFTEWDGARAAFVQSLLDAECAVKVILTHRNPPPLDPMMNDAPGGIAFVSPADWQAGLESL